MPRRFRPPPLRRASGGGAGPDLVAVPGLGLSVDGWRATLTLLAPTAAVAVALPAFGLPAGRDAALDPMSSAERLLARLDRLGADRVVLCGHSASCQVVAEVARRVPDRVRGLVLVGPATDPRGATWLRLAERWLRTAAREPLGQVPLLVRDYTYSGLVSFARAMDASRRHGLEQALADVRCPVLVVRGPDDRIAPRDWVDRLAALPGRTEAATLAAGAHMVPLTHPHELADRMRPFLRELADPAGRDGRVRAPAT